MTPTQLPNESHAAYSALQCYCADPKRSIRRCARKLRKSPTIIARFSKKYRWQQRLRELALEDCARSVAADEQAKLNVAEERERERTLFQQRAIEVSRRATEKGLEILKQSATGCKPSDGARLLAVADMIGRNALGLGGESAQGAFGLRNAPINIAVVVEDDAESLAQKEREEEFFRAHPELV